MIKEKVNKIRNNKFYLVLVKNSFWAFIGDASASVLNLIITIILIKIMGNGDYGILVLAQAYMQIVDVILNVQSWKAVIQFGQKSIVANDNNALNGYIKLGIILDFSTAIIGGIIAIIIAPVIGGLFNWSNELIICCMIFSITIFSHLSGTSTALLRILNKFHLVAIQKFITSLIKLIFMIVIMFGFENASLIHITIAYCITDMIGNILLVLLAIFTYAKKDKLINVVKAKLPKEQNEFIRFTLWSTLGGIVDIPVNYFDVFIVSLLGNESVSVFKVFKQIISILKKVTSPIQQSIMPQFSELVAKDEREKGYNIVLKIRKVILKIIGPIAILLGLTSPIWLKALYGSVYAKNWYILLFYLLIQTFALSYATIHPFFTALNKEKKSTLYILIANITYMILAYSLVVYIGLFGMIIAILVQNVLAIYLKKRDIKKLLSM